MLISDLEQDEAQVAVGRGRLRLGPTGRLTIALLLLAAVCGWVLTRTGPTDNRLLVVDETGAISLLDPETGRSVFEVAGATATPDRSALLTTRSTGDDTVLESRDPVEGRVTGSTRLDPTDLTVRTVSPQGDAVALMPGPRGSGIYEPESRDRTSITVSYLDDRPPDVRGHAVLGRTLGRLEHDLVGFLVGDAPPHELAPPAAQPDRIDRVDAHALPTNRHAVILADRSADHQRRAPCTAGPRATPTW